MFQFARKGGSGGRWCKRTKGWTIQGLDYLVCLMVLLIKYNRGAISLMGICMLTGKVISLWATSHKFSNCQTKFVLKMTFSIPSKFYWFWTNSFHLFYLPAKPEKCKCFFPSNFSNSPLHSHTYTPRYQRVVLGSPLPKRAGGFWWNRAPDGLFCILIGRWTRAFTNVKHTYTHSQNARNIRYITSAANFVK